uniref:transmembrane protein 64 isoform X2 n=1 Tax=Ciona intestinalis TaxID=7719 RepID=UPI000EF50A87|nr:transmembrane protein 64 isoform X2 [Ciona intestinalis]|eukprot:XP_026689692.1 transmembrane protein 64 isoform X2 [Ciona intestinalis]
MLAASSAIKYVFDTAETYFLRAREIFTKALLTRSEEKPLHQSQELNLLYDEALPETKRYACETKTSTICSHSVCTPCRLCFKCTQRVSECAKHTVACVIYLLCYPFIPCVVAILPSCCQIPGYANVNPLYSCWGANCCTCPNCSNDTDHRICSYCRTQNCYLLFISILLVILCVGIWTGLQDSEVIVNLLFYFESVNKAQSLLLFVLLFTLVSFPMMWGYLPLNLTVGYIYGFLIGIPVVVFSVSVGVTVAHIVCKKYMSTCVLNLLRKRSNFDQIEATLQVIAGPSGLKVIALTRLTPIPFGFQNGLFSVSNIDMKRYLIASNLGLLPTQVLNCYIGSTFRSIEQLVEQENTSGYLIFLIQIVIGVCLMMFVLRHARKELAVALQSNVLTCPETLPLSEELIEVKCSQPQPVSPISVNDVTTPLLIS